MKRTRIAGVLMGVLSLALSVRSMAQDTGVLRVEAYGCRLGTNETFTADADAISFREALALSDHIVALQPGESLVCVAREPAGQRATSWYADTAAFNAIRRTYAQIPDVSGASVTLGYATLTNLFSSADIVQLAVGYDYVRYAVAFENNGGTGSMTRRENLSYDAAWTLPACSLVRDGYRFIGWRQKDVPTARLIPDGAKVAGSDFTIENHDDAGIVTLVAEWARDTFAITATASRFGFGSVEPAEQAAKTNTTVTLTATAHTGGVFWRWSDGETANPRSVLVVSNAAYRADFVPVRSKVTFAPDLDGATVVPSSRLVAYGSAYGALPTPTHKTRLFDHWALTPSGTEAVTPATTVSATDAHTLHAVWKTLFDVAFSYKAGSGRSVTERQAVSKGEPAEPPSLASVNTYAGHTFTHWNSTAYQSVSSDLSIDAVYRANTYTIAFDANGGTGTTADQVVTYGSEAYLRTCDFAAPQDKVFAGWTTNAASTAVVYADGQRVKDLTAVDGATITLYAVWKVNTYTVAFDANGGTGSPRVQTFTYGQSQRLWANAYEAPVGKKFAGWATNEEASVVVYLDGQSVQDIAKGEGETVTLYAVWDELAPGVISYYSGLDGAAGDPTNVTFKVNAEVTLLGEHFTAATKKLVGWAETRGAAKAKYELNAHVTFTSSAAVTLYGVWESKGDSIVRYLSGVYHGTEKTNDTPVTVGSTIQLADSPFVRTGYTFRDWTGPDGTCGSGATYTVKDGINAFTANWTTNSYTVKYWDGGKEVLPATNVLYDQEFVLPQLPSYDQTWWGWGGWGKATELGGAVVSNLTSEADGVVDLTAHGVSNFRLIRALGLTNDVSIVAITNAYVGSIGNEGGWADSDGGAEIDAGKVLYVCADRPGTLSFQVKGAAGTYRLNIGWGAIKLIDGVEMTVGTEFSEQAVKQGNTLVTNSLFKLERDAKSVTFKNMVFTPAE